MVDRTSTATTPWTLVEANNKYHARIKVLKTLCEAVEQALARKGGKPGKAIKISKAAKPGKISKAGESGKSGRGGRAGKQD
jgi:hypothetical protein